MNEDREIHRTPFYAKEAGTIDVIDATHVHAHFHPRGRGLPRQRSDLRHDSFVLGRCLGEVGDFAGHRFRHLNLKREGGGANVLAFGGVGE